MSGCVICPESQVSGRAGAKMWASDMNIITIGEFSANIF